MTIYGFCQQKKTGSIIWQLTVEGHLSNLHVFFSLSKCVYNNFHIFFLLLLPQSVCKNNKISPVIELLI